MLLCQAGSKFSLTERGRETSLFKYGYYLIDFHLSTNNIQRQIVRVFQVTLLKGDEAL